MRLTRAVLPATLALAVAGGAPLTAQEHETVNTSSAIRDQKQEHAADVRKALNTLGTPETVYDYITFGISGPVVVLQGFTINGALRDNALAQVKKLDWVTHVVQEVELHPLGPEVKRVRMQILGILKKQVPTAYPQNHANIRIGVNRDGVVTLIGIIREVDKPRYEAALERIKHVTFVAEVKDKVVIDT